MSMPFTGMTEGPSALFPSQSKPGSKPSSRLSASQPTPRKSLTTPANPAARQRNVSGSLTSPQLATKITSARPCPSNGVTIPHSRKDGIDENVGTEEQDLTKRVGFEPRGDRPVNDPESLKKQAIVWLDIDNTLYKKSTKIAELMGERIRAYFIGMGLAPDEAKSLHQQYYKTYGLAIRGLVKHHQIDPLDYDRKCDASLPLEEILRPDPSIIKLLSDLDRTKVRVFALTNAYKQHADRVLKLLDLKDQVEGIVYCDYAIPDFSCKPELDYYKAAMKFVGATCDTKCYFVDDSSLNIVAAKELNWHSCVFFKEEDDLPPPSQEDQQAASSFDLSVMAPHTNDLGQPSGFDEAAIKAECQKLPSHMRIRLLSIILDACLPGDIASISRTLEKHLRMTRDVASNLTDSTALKIFEKLPIQDLLRCRQVSKKWLSLATWPEIWRSHALALTQGDSVKVQPPSDPSGWEALVKGLFFRERNWTKGIAQKIDLFQGHTGFVTSIKLKGRKTLVTGSYDETIRIWDLSAGTCKKVLKAKAIACLDFLLDEGILAAGLYDSGRVMIWDMKTWELIQTLSGHNRGIRNVALNSDYLVSVGQDKAIVVWDWKTGTKLVRFGQQSNVSLGVSLVDSDKLVAVTVDGVIRSFSIRRKEMIGQFHLADLGTQLANGIGMLEWFAAHGNTMTVASKNLVIHLEWQEHVVPVKEMPISPPSLDGLRRSVSSRLSTITPTRQRVRKDSLQSNTSVKSPTTPIRTRKDSTASNTSSASRGNSSFTRSPTISTPSRPSPRLSTSHKLGAPTPWLLPLDESRIAPNLSVAPRVVSTLETPDMAIGCVDPSKRRVVCSTRFSSRAGADRRLYTWSLALDLGQTYSQLEGEQKEQQRIAPIVGAWRARAEELQTPSRNPMAMVLDHESVVVGCADGTVYRIGFVGSDFDMDASPSQESLIGDATIDNLLQLREVWHELFLPPSAPSDHPGRLQTNKLKSLGLN